MDYIKCENCGFTDMICDKDPMHFADVGFGEICFFSKKTQYIVKMNLKDTKKYADKKFCAKDIKNKDKYEWTKDFKISDLKCPECGQKKFNIVKSLEA